MRDATPERMPSSGSANLSLLRRWTTQGQGDPGQDRNALSTPASSPRRLKTIEARWSNIRAERALWLQRRCRRGRRHGPWSRKSRSPSERGGWRSRTSGSARRTRGSVCGQRVPRHDLSRGGPSQGRLLAGRRYRRVGSGRGRDVGSSCGWNQPIDDIRGLGACLRDGWQRLVCKSAPPPSFVVLNAVPDSRHSLTATPKRRATSRNGARLFGPVSPGAPTLEKPTKMQTRA
jgi:hypothetical protein